MPEIIRPKNCPLFGGAETFRPIESFGGQFLYECSDCGVQFWHPVKPAPEKEFYETSKMYEFVKRRALAWYHSQFINNPPAKEGVLLDVGFGQGEFLDAVRTRMPAVEYWGVDLAERNVVMATENYRLERIYADSLDAFLDKRHMQFDVVTSFEVIEHVPDPVAFVASVARAVKVGGYFALSTPNLARFGGSGEGWDFPPNHLFRWNKETLSRLLVAHGFRVVRAVEQSFTRDFFFNKGFLSFGLMRRLRAGEVIVKDGVGAVATGEVQSAARVMVRSCVSLAAVIKNAVLRVILLPVELIMRIFGVKYWDLYIIAERI